MAEPEAPDAFCCPIGLNIMVDPVFLIETGHTFERTNIETHLKNSDRAPMSGVQLQNKTLVPNHALWNAIQVYLAARGGGQPEAPSGSRPAAGAVEGGSSLPPPPPKANTTPSIPTTSEPTCITNPDGNGIWFSQQDPASGTCRLSDHTVARIRA